MDFVCVVWGNVVFGVGGVFIWQMCGFLYEVVYLLGFVLVLVVFICIIIDMFGCNCLVSGWLGLMVIWIGRCCMILVKLLLVLFGCSMLNFELVVGVICLIWLCSCWLLKVFIEKVVGWLMCIFQVWFFLKLVIIYNVLGIRNSNCELVVMY